MANVLKGQKNKKCIFLNENFKRIKNDEANNRILSHHPGFIRSKSDFFRFITFKNQVVEVRVDKLHKCARWLDAHFVWFWSVYKMRHKAND